MFYWSKYNMTGWTNRKFYNNADKGLMVIDSECLFIAQCYETVRLRYANLIELPEIF